MAQVTPRRPGEVGGATLIAALPLSNRTRSRLLEAGLETVEALLGRRDEELLALEGLGHTCLRELRAVLRVHELGGTAGAGDRASFPTALPEELLAAKLAHLPISNRARGVFEREGIETVRQYVELGPSGLLALRNFGETTLQSVNGVLHAAAATLAQRATPAAAPFAQDFDLLADVELRPDLAQVPLSALDLPRRARRACQDLGLRTLRDFARVSSGDLLLRRNFGQATLRRIQREVERFVKDSGELQGRSFAALLDLLLRRLQPRERTLVELREGRKSGAALTLTEAGRQMEITESRACQIEHAAWNKLRRFGAGLVDPAADQAVHALLLAGGVAPPSALLANSYFAPAATEEPLQPLFVARMLARLLPHRLTLLSDGRLAATPAATLFTLAARLRKRLQKSGESQLLASLAEDVLRGLDVGVERVALLKALCETMFHREVTADAKGNPIVRTQSQGLGDDLREVLLEAGQPLHFAEIARRMAAPPRLRQDMTEEQVRLRLCRDRRFVLVSRGLYDLRERFHVAPESRQVLAGAALELIRAAGRPMSVALLCGMLRGRATLPQVSEFVLARLLREDERFTHLGRGTFVPRESSQTSVQHVSEILESILREHGGPLCYAELRRRVQLLRRVSDGAISATLVGRGAFVRVARGEFDLAERHPFGDAARARLALDARAALEAKGGVLGLDQLVAELDWSSLDGAPPPSPVLLGDLLRRTGGFQFLNGGFVSLGDERLERELAARARDLLQSAMEPLRPATIARRLALNDGAASLLRHLLRRADGFRVLDDGRVELG